MHRDLSPLDDAPRSMRCLGERQRRKAMLREPHIAPLTEYVEGLREKKRGVEVPYFDPLDGGTGAGVLFLFEKPGPMTGEKGKKSGSGFISRNNDDPTAEATFRFMEEAGIPRKMTVTWNIIPWWNGTRKVKAAEIREGAECVEQLIGLLPELRAVVFVGKKAAKAKKTLKTGLVLLESIHPSPIVKARWPARWKAIPSDWSKVKSVIGLD